MSIAAAAADAVFPPYVAVFVSFLETNCHLVDWEGMTGSESIAVVVVMGVEAVVSTVFYSDSDYYLLYYMDDGHSSWL